MGLFARAADDDPLEAVRGAVVEAAHLLEDALVVKLKSRKGEVVLDVPGRAGLASGGSVSHKGQADFERALPRIVGARVRRATVDGGKAVRFDLGGRGELTVSLVEGEYPGPSALKVKGPGPCLASYHCDGMTKLQL